ncbi:hypothetical protein A2V54_02750 [candidate division WWE3 bacterium RBG_19FT_COMBO_53_11]|uniref:DUF7467 domain-containing protein n=1 Tax=candidate division WWE3 bacterium RBG_19FT_COMBO_53_11 TaxID=1802613 RepID=A0A1F4UJK1_UNCKA|nr:MAG: hypothetical protein A2V54_02750 [candidate division WWE3 bacterium RBG_19FT_COMBO_53_11]
MLARLKKLSLVAKLIFTLLAELVVLVIIYTATSSANFVLGPSNLVNGSCTADNTPTLTVNPSGVASFKFQVDDSAGFSSLLVDYQTLQNSFTVGQALGAGTYLTGSPGQTLADGNYYWRAKTTETPDCGVCDGQVTRLTLRYDGDRTTQVKVKQRSDGHVVFEDTVTPGELFSFSGTWVHGVLGPSINIYVRDAGCSGGGDDDGDNGSCTWQQQTSIHTSCSAPIGPGLVSGDFTVIAGESRNGGSLCPLNGGDGEEEIIIANSGNVAFRVDTTPPTKPCTPASTSGLGDSTPTWAWNASTDASCGLNSPAYTVGWSQDQTFGSGVSSATTNTNSFTHPTELSNGTWYFRAKAVDVVGNESDYCTGSTQICVGCGGTNPPTDGNGGNGGNGNPTNGNGQEEEKTFDLVVRTVNDNDDSPIAGCGCMLFSDPRFSISDENGECFFGDVGVGDHRIVCTCGEQTRETMTTITGNEPLTLAFVPFGAEGTGKTDSTLVSSSCSACQREFLNLLSRGLGVLWLIAIGEILLLLLLLLFLLYLILSRRRRRRDHSKQEENKSGILSLDRQT